MLPSILGLYRDNGKENGNNYNFGGYIWGYITIIKAMHLLRSGVGRVGRPLGSAHESRATKPPTYATIISRGEQVP